MPDLPFIQDFLKTQGHFDKTRIPLPCQHWKPVAIPMMHWT